MKKQYNSWETNLGQRLQQLQGQPPANAWERLEAELDQKPRRNAWWMAAAIGLLLGSGAYTSWQLLDSTPLPGLASGRTELPHQQPIATEQQRPGARSGPEEQATPANLPGLGQTGYAEPATASAPASGAGRMPGSIPSSPPLASEGVAYQPSPSALIPARSAVVGTVAARAQATPAADKPVAGQAAASYLGGEAAVTSLMPAAAADNTTALPRLAARQPEGFPLRYRLSVPRIARPQEDWYAVVTPEKEGKKGKKALLWTELMPTWSYRKVEPNPADAVVITAMESQPAFSGSRLGAQAAIGLSLPVRKNLEWKSGAFYGMQQEQWSYSYRNSQADYYSTRLSESGSYTVVPEYINRTNEINHTLHNMGLTTGLRYSLPTRFSTSHADARLLTFYNRYQKVSSFITLAYSIELPFDTGFGIHIGPSLQLQLHSSADLSPHFQEKPLVFGLQLGASMNRP